MTVCERFCPKRRRFASPPSTGTVASWSAARECSYSSARVPISVYIWFVTNATRPFGM